MGFNLVDAEKALTDAQIAYTTHASDAAFGILVKDNFVVCEVVRISDRMVRLEVAKDGC